MTEQEYVVNTFYEHFSSYNNRDIAIYGLGSHTKMVLDAFPDFSVRALLDGYQVDGIMYGKPIIPIEKIVNLNIKIVIIIARAASVKIIFNRISGFCMKNGIRVFDIMGNELTVVQKSADNDNEEFETDFEDVKQAIREHEIISFDIFNTLIMRKLYQEQDLFYLVQKKIKSYKFNFIKVRTQAEWELAEKNPVLEEIYTRIRNQTGISDTEAAQIMEAEINIQKEVLVLRDTIKQIFDYAVLLGKKVYFISDMYFTKLFLQNILISFGIVGYKDIFVSCEYRSGKRQRLFDEFKSLVKGNSYLHIGDDEEADGTFAKLNNMNYILIDSPTDMIAKSAYRTLLKQTDVYENHFAVGLLAANLFKDPFSLYKSKGRPVIQSAYQLGYIFIAPVLTNFIIWLTNCMKRKKYDRILFLSRDGYLIQQLYEEAVKIMGLQEKVPESSYFLTSRAAGISATAVTEENIKYASGLSFDGSPEELLKKRFFLDSEEIECYDVSTNETLSEYILHHSDKIKSRAQELSKNYNQYIRSLHFRQDENLVFFDFVSTGTCQMCIEELTGRKLDGYYFMRLPEDYYRKKRLSVLSYFDSDTMYTNKSSACENYFFLENIIKSLEPSISYFDKEGKPVYQVDSRTKDQKNFINEVQQGVLDYSKEYLYMIRDNEINFDKIYADMLLNLMQNQYSVIDISGIKQGIIRDEFCNRTIAGDMYLI